MATILIVDDMESNREIISRFLAMHGYDHIIATNGKEAVDIAKISKPELILMDMGLPIMDGWEATKMIKNDINTSGIPIIAVSAHVMATDREKAEKAGCADYIGKPVEFTKLLELIQRYI